MYKVFFIGIGGIGMSGTAGIAKAMDYEVAGSERGKILPPSSEVLKSLNIPVFLFSEKNISTFKPDLVVVGNAVKKDHEEVRKCEELNIPIYSFPQFLERFVFLNKKVLVCAGTHGKTTSSALLSYSLEKMGLDPTYLVGGILNTGKNYRKGNSIWCVVEGDEYPSSFFDPYPKFFHYHPFGLLLTSLEHDHVDVYPSLQSLKEAFIHLIKEVPENGLIVYNGDDLNLREIMKVANPRARTISYGKSRNNDYVLLESLTSFKDGSFKTKILLRDKKKEKITFTASLLGEHNALNALGVFALLNGLNILKDRCFTSLESFPGVKRRHEVLYHSDRVTIIDDFAHHPTEVRVTLEALIRALEPKLTILVFEPRTNSSKRKIFQERYAEVLALADVIYIKEPPNLESIPEEERIDLIKLSQILQDKGKRVYLLNKNLNLGEFKGERILVVFMSSAFLEEEIKNLLSFLKSNDGSTPDSI